MIYTSKGLITGSHGRQEALKTSCLAHRHFLVYSLNYLVTGFTQRFAKRLPLFQPCGVRKKKWTAVLLSCSLISGHWIFGYCVSPLPPGGGDRDLAVPYSLFDQNVITHISGSIDACVNAWDCRSRKTDPIQVLNEAKDSVSSIQISDAEILTGSVDKYIRRYDVRNGKMVADCIGRKHYSLFTDVFFL